MKKLYFILFLILIPNVLASTSALTEPPKDYTWVWLLALLVLVGGVLYLYNERKKIKKIKICKADLIILENYIKEQKEKGIPKKPLLNKIVESGWNKTLSKILIENIYKNKNKEKIK